MTKMKIKMLTCCGRQAGPSIYAPLNLRDREGTMLTYCGHQKAPHFYGETVQQHPVHMVARRCLPRRLWAWTRASIKRLTLRTENLQIDHLDHLHIDHSDRL